MAEPVRPRGLGRGLAALVAEFPTDHVAMVELEISQVRPNPRQPRRVFDNDAIERLAESVRADGVVQPIIVRDAGDGYEIVAGERRWRAAQLAGLRTIPSLVRSADERELLILALAENVAREDLNAVDQARAYAVLADELDLSQTEIARRVGKSRPAVANTMRLLELPDDVLEHGLGGDAVGGPRPRAPAGLRPGRAGRAGPHGGRPGLVCARPRGRRQARRPAKPAAKRAPGAMDDELSHLVVDAAWQSLALRAGVRRGPRGGRVEIHFTTPAELGRIVDQLRAERVSWAD